MMTRITIAKGDGIGPEIMEATLSILAAAGAELAYDEIEIGEKVYLAGNASKKGLIELLTAAESAGIDVVKTENLYAFDGKAAYSLGQGQ